LEANATLSLNYFDNLLENKKETIRDFFKSSKVFLKIALSNSYMFDLEKQILNSYQNFMNNNSLAEIFEIYSVLFYLENIGKTLQN